MKKILMFLVASFAGVSVSANADIEILELDKNRQGMEYAAKIYELEKVINSHKWNDGSHRGYIVTIESNELRNKGSDDIWAKIEHFSHDMSMNESTYEVVQSQRQGYVQFINIENAQNTYHFKIIDNDTLEVVQKADERNPSKIMNWRKVDEFQKRKRSEKRLESAEESGLIF